MSYVNFRRGNFWYVAAVMAHYHRAKTHHLSSRNKLSVEIPVFGLSRFSAQNPTLSAGSIFRHLYLEKLKGLIFNMQTSIGYQMSCHWHHLERSGGKVTPKWKSSNLHNNTTTTVLRPFVQDYPGESLPEETLTHSPSWSSSSLYQLLPSATIHNILLVQSTCLAIFLHNLFPCPFWSTSWSGALHLIFHTLLHPISVFFSQHMPIPSQPVLL